MLILGIIYVIISIIIYITYIVILKIENEYDDDKVAAWILVSMFWLIFIPMYVISFLIDYITDKIADFWRSKHHEK